MPDGVFRPKSYLPPVPEGPAGYEGPQLSAPSDVEAHLYRLATQYPEIYQRVFRVLLQIGSQSSARQGFGSQSTYYRGYLGSQGGPGWQGVQGGQGAQGGPGWQGVQGGQGAQGWQGSQGLPGRLGSEGHEGIPSELGMFFGFDRLYTIPELEIIGHALGCPYLFIGSETTRRPFEANPAMMDFVRQGRFIGFPGFNVGQLPGYNPDGSLFERGREAAPYQCAIRAYVECFCGECEAPISEWVTRGRDQTIVSGHCTGAIQYRNGRAIRVIRHSTPPRQVRIRLESLEVAGAGVTYWRPRGE